VSTAGPQWCKRLAYYRAKTDRYATIKRILADGLDHEPAGAAAPLALPPPQFARPWTDFFAATGGEHV
jgi:hypothetical protein